MFRKQKAMKGGVDVDKYYICSENRKLWKEGWMWLNIKYVKKTESYGRRGGCG